MKNKNLPNKKKLLNSKWTALRPTNKEKHFTITHVELNKVDPQVVEYVILSAIMTKNDYQLGPKALEDANEWQQGWT